MRTFGRSWAWIALIIITLITASCTSANTGTEKNGPANTPASNGQSPPPSGQNSGNDAVDSDSGTGNNTDAGGSESMKIVAENKAFRIFSPAPDSTVGQSFVVKGQARVFEAAFSYTFEDGHNNLAEGHVMADIGAPEWGNFEFTVTFDNPTSPTGVLTIYEVSAKDGEPTNQLTLPVKFKADLLKEK